MLYKLYKFLYHDIYDSCYNEELSLGTNPESTKYRADKRFIEDIESTSPWNKIKKVRKWCNQNITYDRVLSTITFTLVVITFLFTFCSCTPVYHGNKIEYDEYKYPYKGDTIVSTTFVITNDADTLMLLKYNNWHSSLYSTIDNRRIDTFNAYVNVSDSLDNEILCILPAVEDPYYDILKDWDRLYDTVFDYYSRKDDNISIFISGESKDEYKYRKSQIFYINFNNKH